MIEELAKTVLAHFTHAAAPMSGPTDVDHADLVAYLGERVGPVLVRLRQAEH
ncbi:hypothetical protein [Nonomuraea sp. NPDC049400]|uniref:hypothetical protein n=1 Tax=Nonomuraea sp. NPDC049400 TaxID=3364352 RepID=UPI0037A43EB2